MRKFKNAMLGMGICLSILMSGCMADAKANVAGSSSIAEELQIYYIDIGQGDASLLEYKGHFMLIDAGDNDDEKAMVDFLNKKNVKVLDYAIGTHPHADHIGGLDAVINNFDVKEVYMPKVQSDTKTFDDVLDAVEAKGLSISTPIAGKEILFADIPIKILAPIQAYDDSNDNSITLKLVYDDVSCLFTGDIEAKAEADILKQGNVSANVLKVAHHGSDTSSTSAFINGVNPQYAIISVGAGNSYGHPNESVVKRFNDKGIQILRTDESGTIILSTKGDTLSFHSEKQVGNVISEAKPSTNASATTYVGNKNSKKFHLLSCNTLPSEKNRLILNTKQEATDAGYTACQNCIGNE